MYFMVKLPFLLGPLVGRSKISAKRGSKKLARCVRSVLEALEVRCLLSSTASISGTVFNDINSNGSQNSGEAGISGTAIYIDTTNAGVFKTGDKETTTSASGTYSFTGLAAGTYIVRQLLPIGEKQDSPTGGLGDHVTVASGQAANSINFGDQSTSVIASSGGSTGGAYISGTVFNDANGNGKQDSGETAISGVTVFNDANNNGKLDAGEMSTTTNSSGIYTFTGIADGAYLIRQILPTGDKQTSPASGLGNHVTITGNQGAANENFGDQGSAVVTPPTTTSGGSISGTIFNDANGNGKQDSGELGIAGVTAYNDATNAGVFKAGDMEATTNSAGVYTFSGLSAGTYIIRQLLPSGDKQTLPSGGLGDHVTLASKQVVTNANFGDQGSAVVTPPPVTSGGSISGIVFSDANGNGKQDSGDAGIAGVTIYNDANNNGVLDANEISTTTNSSGAYTLSGLSAGAYVLRQILPTGSKQTLPASGLGNHVTLTSGQASTNINFGDQSVAVPTSTVSTPVVSGSWAKYTAGKSSDSSAPQAVLLLLAPVKMVGINIVVQGNTSALGHGSQITTNYQWNFGDSSGQYNTLNGYNASHVYNNPGTYTITLTVTNDLHKVSVVSAQVTIAADSRNIIYVDSVHGSDSNNGSSPSQALKTEARADQVLRSNTEILFDRGEEFNMTTTFLTPYTNVVIGAYGSGANPIMNWNMASGGVMFSNSPVSIGVTFENLTIDTMNHADPGASWLPQAIVPRGTNIDINNITFLDADYDINANSAPTGLMITNCSSPLSNGLSAYFVWNQAIDSVILGNTVVNSIHEHIIRTSGASEILIADNNFTNNDGKGCIEVHEGSYAWVEDNTVTNGDIRVGPLGLWDEPVTDITQYAVIQGNIVNNVDINVQPGSDDISIRNNIINRNGGTAIDVSSTDSLGHTSGDIQILNNTAIDTGTTGNFVIIEDHTYGVILANNLMVAPNLIPGSGGTAPVNVDESNLSSFTYIGGNVWPSPTTIYAFAKGGINYVGTSYVSSGYFTPAAWNAQSVVANDIFSNVTISSSYAPSSSGIAANADTYIAGIFYDLHGNPIPASGSISAGAVQV
jgi:SdrD B-like domain/PKD domain